jgi:hypothetical protein
MDINKMYRAMIISPIPGRTEFFVSNVIDLNAKQYAEIKKDPNLQRYYQLLPIPDNLVLPEVSVDDFTAVPKPELILDVIAEDVIAEELVIDSEEAIEENAIIEEAQEILDEVEQASVEVEEVSVPARKSTRKK